jgi:hypothetical protein
MATTVSCVQVAWSLLPRVALMTRVVVCVLGKRAEAQTRQRGHQADDLDPDGLRRRWRLWCPRCTGDNHRLSWAELGDLQLNSADAGTVVVIGMGTTTRPIP